ncbi:PREDICTED: eukaryotic peptide chain release factor GTP-binding subunit ERF3A-like [Priapulus caudatus]|uniref:Eukaryotic peptide chain release factor GTP-binding subunit ERF3A-like n=1 Tax=Priapulus caudatus TaxID=37621 RepID=A0ABM1DTD8_PRICU|nr:PREDICTED: eukaryotic peptide chain release factor GTP-binding subunit ERF3A-like [Priapulus caudatus]
MDPTDTQKHEVNNWEDRGDLEPGGNGDPVEKLTKPFSGSSFGFNPDAAPFVPSFGSAQPQNNIVQNAENTSGETNTVRESSPPAAASLTDGGAGREDSPVSSQDDAADSWEAQAEESPASTPEDEEEEETSDAPQGEGVRAPPKPRKKHISNEPLVKKEHINVVFIGHVDAGKSTIGGHIMYLTGMVEKRTLEKYEREAKEKNRETWYLSWALDTNQEERDKGKTVEVGRAFFETANRHFTILDAPGHRSFVPNMIGGASQADLAVLVISARKGEFETGFERGGQTREHAMLAKTAGVKHLIVLINKMDDPTVQWEETRYNDCKEKLIPYLKKLGFNPKTDLYFMPCSGLTGAFLKYPIDEQICSWYRGPCLIEYIDSLPSMSRQQEGPVRMPIVDRYRDMGTVVLGKLESGKIYKGQMLLLMPNRTSVEVMTIISDEIDTNEAESGENIKVKLKGVEEEDVSQGFVLCTPNAPCSTASTFDAQVVILEHKSIICAGYSCVLHIHTCIEEVTIKALLCLIDKKTGEKSKTRPRFIKQDQIAIVRFQSAGTICVESFKDFAQMGRFTLRDEGRSIAIGKVLKIIE